MAGTIPYYLLIRGGRYEKVPMWFHCVAEPCGKKMEITVLAVEYFMEAVAHGYSKEWLLLKILQNSVENTCNGDIFSVQL